MFTVQDIDLFINRKNPQYKKYGWKIRIRNAEQKSFSVKLYIDATNNSLTFAEVPSKYCVVADLDDEILDTVRDYLIDNNEIYMGEDGDYYLVGENN